MRVFKKNEECLLICLLFIYYRISELNSIRDDINSSSVGNMLFDNTLTTTKNAFSLQSLQNQNTSDVNRLSNELMTKNSQIVKLTNRIDETARKVSIGNGWCL